MLLYKDAKIEHCEVRIWYTVQCYYTRTARIEHCEVRIWYTVQCVIQGLLELSSVKLGSGTRFSVIIQGC